MNSKSFPIIGKLPQPVSLSNGLLSPRSPSVVGTPKASSPFDTKVSAILSTSYSDADFRDALTLLDDRGIGNNTKTRRQIRLDIQKEVIESNGAIINEFGHVAEQLRLIGSTLRRLNAGYDAMKSQVVSAHTGTQLVSTEAATLFQQRSQVKTKQEVLGAFRDHFLMSGADIAALTSSTEPVDERFLQSLARAKKIVRDCEILLGFEKQALGFDLMERTSQNIDFGFQKLNKWVQREFMSLDLENPQMNPAMRRALRVLAERPPLFRSCLDYFTGARERNLSDAFHVALTGSGPSGEEQTSPKPIDLAAHDPLRYVGDMLAWVHSTAVNEREVLEVLFISEGNEIAQGVTSGRDAEIWRLVADEDDKSESNAPKALIDLVDRDVAGASRLLRQRVEQATRANEDTITGYKLAALIGFYRITFQKLLGPESNLFGCVKDLEREALRQFRALVRDHIAALQVDFQQPPTELGPPCFLNDALARLKEIMRTFESSLVAPEDREGEFAEVLSETFQPFISGCENMAMAIEPPNNTIFVINCKLAAAKTLECFDFARRDAARVRAAVAHEAMKLVTYQHKFFCQGSGFSSLLEQVQGDPSKADRGLDKGLLEGACRQLDEFLPSALIDAMDNLNDIQDLTLAREITEAAANQFCEDFRALEVLVEEKNQGEGDKETGLRYVLPRTTADIRVLLS